MRKRLLVLLGGYYPSYGAPGIVFEKMLPVLRERFEVVILTPRRKQHGLGSIFFNNGAEVHEISDWINDHVVGHGRRSFGRLAWRVVQKLWWMIQRQPLFLYSIRNTIKTADQLHNERKFDAVLSVSFPPYAHITAALFKARHPSVKWCAYSTDTLFGHDLLNGKIGNFLYGDVLRREMAACRHADGVFFTPEIYAWRERMFPNGDLKPRMLNYILSLPDENDEVRAGANDGKVHLVYAGVFYERTRNPDWFAGVMRELLSTNNDYIFDFYLATDVCKNVIASVANDFPENVKIHPPVQPSEIWRIMRQADFLLNFSNDVDQFSPSKIFDYVATGRPILNMAYNGRKVNDVLTRNPLVLTVVNGADVRVSAEKINDFIEQNKDRRLDVGEMRSLYAEYMPEAALAELMGCL